MALSLITTECPSVSLSLKCGKPIKYSSCKTQMDPEIQRCEKNGHILKSYWCLDLNIYSIRGWRDPCSVNNGAPPAQSQISGAEILPLGIRSHPPSPTGATDWTSIVSLLTRQAALTTASSEAHLNLAPRIWQKDTSRAGRTQPEDEYTSALPKPRTRTIVVAERKQACPGNVFSIFIDQVIRFVGIVAVSRIDVSNYLKKNIYWIYNYNKVPFTKVERAFVFCCFNKPSGPNRELFRVYGPEHLKFWISSSPVGKDGRIFQRLKLVSGATRSPGAREQ